MGALLDKPNTDKDTEIGSGNNLRYGVSAMQGWKPEMEDRHLSCPHLPQLRNVSMFGVMDGHGGEFTSSYVAKHFLRVLKSVDLYQFYATLPAQSLRDHPIGNDILTYIMVNAYMQLDEEMLSEEYATRWVKIDSRNGKQCGLDQSGCTFLLVLVTPKHIICVNAGDSRACYRTNGKTVQLSFDHKPSLETEQERIEAAGGYVSMDRVDGDLSVSRGLGDFRYKQDTELPPDRQKLTCFPEITVHNRDPRHDEFIVLASHGVWDVMSCEECTDAVQNMFDEGENDVGLVCEELMDGCLDKESKENMTAAIVTFPAVKISPTGGGIAARRSERKRKEEVKRREQARKDRIKTERRAEAVLVRKRLLERAKREAEEGRD